jgi:hypothetical protein
VGRLEEGADYGSGKASRFYRSPHNAYIRELEQTNLATAGWSDMRLAIASFIIHCPSWQARKPKELDQSFVRVARHTASVQHIV